MNRKVIEDVSMEKQNQNGEGRSKNMRNRPNQKCQQLIPERELHQERIEKQGVPLPRK